MGKENPESVKEIRVMHIIESCFDISLRLAGQAFEICLLNVFSIDSPFIILEILLWKVPLYFLKGAINPDKTGLERKGI